MHTNWNCPETTTAPLYQPAADKQGHDSPLTNKRKVKLKERVLCSHSPERLLAFRSRAVRAHWL